MSFVSHLEMLDLQSFDDFFKPYGLDPRYGYPHELELTESELRMDPTPLNRILRKEDDEDTSHLKNHPLVDDIFGNFDHLTQEDLEAEKNKILNESIEGFESSSRPCAWYNPLHFYRNWGIYMRGPCLVRIARKIACFVDWSCMPLPKSLYLADLHKAAFYVLYLHEQFHHKVESFALRLLVSTSKDHYSPYSANVYQTTFLSLQCLEESIANAESYRRLSEERYRSCLHPAIYRGVRAYVKQTMPQQPPGYREGVHYLQKERHRAGVQLLQSQVQSGSLMPKIPPVHWTMAPNMMRSLKPISSRIFIVLPVGLKPLFPPRWKP